MPPEYTMDGVYSVKSDVYSFGVLVIEILSGKKNRLFSHPDHSLNLIGHVSTYEYILPFLCFVLTTFITKIHTFRHGKVLRKTIFCD